MIMIRRSPLLIVFLAIFINPAFTQKKKDSRLGKVDKMVLANLKTHITYLADDKLEGRRAGTKGEQLAAEYISEEFRKIGVEPKGNSGYLQTFEIYDGKQVDATTHLIINGNSLTYPQDYFPFPFSPAASIESIATIAIQEAGVPWFYDLKDVLEDNESNPHFDINAYIATNASKAHAKGATAIILYNSEEGSTAMKFEPKDRSERSAVPVIYVSREVATKYFADESASLDIKLRTSISDKIRKSHNVVGYINNGALRTVVLGAHYDHLGFGEDGNSMHRGGEKQIHNGADDNASGTAAVIELARLLKSSKNKSSNYLFIAFSAEELGLNGSKYFVENPTVSLSSVNYMINMDMIGRMNDSSKAVTIGGFGTAPEWQRFIVTNDPRLPFSIKIDSSGTGPSDHTSFYRKDIPVLFFFTGVHSDYHRPGDDHQKINYEGELKIINYIHNLIQATNQYDQKFTFSKTREPQMASSARFSVSMGVMPDYSYAGTGLRIDGVSEGRSAQAAGMKSGDIIIQLGDYKVSDIQQYMQALSKFKKGDKTKVKFKRGDETIEADVQF